MSLKRVLAIGALGAAMAACNGDTEGVLLPQERIGHVRYVHASPDTRALDFRVVDIPSNAGLFGAPYRMTLPFHTALRAGNRSFRAFVSSSHVDTAQIRLMDIQHQINEGVRYTIYLTGTGAPEPFITEDDAPDPGAANYTIRVTHVGAGMPAVDAVVIDDEDNELQVASNVAFRGTGSWTAVPAGAGHTLEIREAGTATVVASVAIPAGSAATPTGQTAVPGSTQAGSGITAIVLAPAVVGSLACPLDEDDEPTCSTALQNPGVVFVYDRRP